MRRFPTVLSTACVLLFVAALWHPAPASAQDPPVPPPEPERADPDARIDPLQPDFSLTALPTTLRMPRNKFAFRVTHRFTRPLGDGDFGDLLRDAFGFDAAAQIGLELRFGLIPGTQVVVHRTTDRTIEIFGQRSFFAERTGAPLGLDAIVGIEGDNNLRQQRRGVVGAVVSRSVARFAALYAEPIWVGNTNAIDLPGTDNDTLLLGLGARLRVRPSLYLLGEITPRLAGYDPGVNQVSFGVEGRAGGHLFQINFSNGWGTTFGQLASRGGITNDNWYIGFNIARKFF
ncbi:MAG: DUF5777 family beta-barrel protein [Vicinamibacterales bacterium]